MYLDIVFVYTYIYKNYVFRFTQTTNDDDVESN